MLSFCASHCHFVAVYELLLNVSPGIGSLKICRTLTVINIGCDVETDSPTVAYCEPLLRLRLNPVAAAVASDLVT